MKPLTGVLSMKPLKQLFLEAIPLSIYREKIFKEIGQEYKTRYQSIFKGQWRIFLPIPDSETQLTSLEEQINMYLSKKRYKISDWEAGLAKSLDSNKTQRIGRLLQALSNDYKGIGDLFRVRQLEEIIKAFNERSKGKGFAKKGGKIAVISRHPYDIAGQSYDRRKFTKGDDVQHLDGYNMDTRKIQKLRDEGYTESGWTSCKHLTTGMNAHYIVSEIDDGCLVAYCVNEEDYRNDKKDALANPISRYLLIPVVNEEDESDTKLYITKNQYGATVKGFYEVVEDWLEDIQGKVDFSEYCVDDDRTYTGDVSGELRIKGGVGKAKQGFESDGWFVDLDGAFTATSRNMSTLDDILPSGKQFGGLSNAFDIYKDYGQYERYDYCDRLHDLMEESFKIDRRLRERFFEKIGITDYTDLRKAIEGIDFKSEVAEQLAEWYNEAETEKFFESMRETASTYIAKTEHLSLDTNEYELTFQCELNDPILQDFVHEVGGDEMLKNYLINYDITYQKIEEEAYENTESVGVDQLDDFIQENIL